jgi:hypothetical protein
MGSSPDRVTPKIMTLLCVASPLSTQHEKEPRLVGSESGGAACLPADCCFSELALY